MKSKAIQDILDSLAGIKQKGKPSASLISRYVREEMDSKNPRSRKQKLAIAYSRLRREGYNV